MIHSNNKSIIIDSPIEKGVIIGFLPKYEEKKDTQIRNCGKAKRREKKLREKYLQCPSH